jgi:hypothetical protein
MRAALRAITSDPHADVEVLNALVRLTQMGWTICVQSRGVRRAHLKVFADIVVLSGAAGFGTVYAGPMSGVVKYFQSLGFRREEAIDNADFLHAVVCGDVPRKNYPHFVPPDLRKLWLEHLVYLRDPDSGQQGGKDRSTPPVGSVVEEDDAAGGEVESLMMQQPPAHDAVSVVVELQNDSGGGATVTPLKLAWAQQPPRQGRRASSDRSSGGGRDDEHEQSESHRETPPPTAEPTVMSPNTSSVGQALLQARSQTAQMPTATTKTSALSSVLQVCAHALAAPRFLSSALA